MQAPQTPRKPQLAPQSIARFDGVALALPCAEIHELAPIDAVAVDEPFANAPASIVLGGVRHPVYILNARFESLARVPASRRQCVLLDAPWATFGLACDEVEREAQMPARLQPIPGCMELIDSPIKALMPRDCEVAFVTNAARLANFLVVPERAA